MSTLDRLRGESPKKRSSKSPTSTPADRPRDPTILSTLPYLATLKAPPDAHNTATFLRNEYNRYYRLYNDIYRSEQDDDQDRINLKKMRDMITLTKTIRGIPGHESAKVYVIDENLQNDPVNRVWPIVIPIYRLSAAVESNAQRPTLNFAKIKLLGTEKNKGKDECAADVLSTDEYERMLSVLITYIMTILGSDCVPVVMRPVVTEGLRKHIEPLTRLGKWDSIEFPATVEGDEKPRFRLLGLSNRKVKQLGWAREGEFGWDHIQEQKEPNGNVS